jgi:uncharacterized membrane protein YeiB
MKWLGWLLVVGTLGFMLVLGATGRDLVTGEAPQGGVSLQLAATSAVAQDVITSWDTRGLMPAAKQQIYLDFPFIAFYVSLIMFACTQLRNRLRAQGVTNWERYAVTGSLAALGTGLADVVEDFAMLGELSKYESRVPLDDWLTMLTAVSASTKFVLLFASILLVIAMDIRSRASARVEAVSPNEIAPRGN